MDAPYAILRSEYIGSLHIFETNKGPFKMNISGNIEVPLVFGHFFILWN